MTRERRVLVVVVVALGLALALPACDRFVSLTPPPDADDHHVVLDAPGHADTSLDAAADDSSIDAGTPQVDGG